jgi:hypothetical protein
MNCPRCGAVVTETQMHCASCGMELPYAAEAKRIQPGLKRAYQPEEELPRIPVRNMPDEGPRSA